MRALIKYILLTVSVIVLFPRKVAVACGFWVYPGEYRFWLLQPDIVNEPDLTPFYFATNYLYNGNQYAGEQPHLEQNINEWYETTNSQASKKDIDSLLNATPPEQFFSEKESLSKKNSLVRYLLQPEQKELHQYMLLSKKVEQIAANPDPWDEQGYPKESVAKVISELKKLRGSTINSFIKLRTAFQLIRLYNYNAQSTQAEQIYDTWIAPTKTKSWVKTAALYQVALNYGGPRGNYLRSKVFDMGGYNRTMCLVKFDSKSTDESLSLAKNKHERNVLLAMKLFNYPGRGLDVIKRIYTSEPKYKELPFLLLREINKVEDWLLTNKVTGFQAPAVYNNSYWDNYEYRNNAVSNYQNDKAYARELSSFLHTMIANSIGKQQAVLHLYAAHMDMLNKDYLSSAVHLKAANLQKHLPPNVKTQIIINRYLLSLENGFGKSIESEFMAIINTPDEKLGIYDPRIMKNQLILYTARKMINNGNKAKGLLLLSKTNRAIGELPIGAYKTVYQEIEERASEEDFHLMLNIFDKKNKSAFENFVCEKQIHSSMDSYEWYPDSTRLKWDRSKLLNCLASWYLRQHRLADAYAVLQKIPADFFKRFPYNSYIGGNPFYLNVYHAHTVSKEDKQDLNEIQVVEQMLRLESLAKKDETKAAECYYQLANAWYNMSYYGKNWLMVKQWWSSNEPNSWTAILKKNAFNDDYYGCQYAKLFYDKAIQITKDKKLAALCFFMSKRCDANYRHYLKNVRGQEEFRPVYLPDYALSKRKGIDQDYYKSIVEECETYQSFIRTYNKKF